MALQSHEIQSDMLDATDASDPLEQRIAAVASRLQGTILHVIAALPQSPNRPQALARTLGVNVVLTSRLLKALRQHDPISLIHSMPGPEPLRRVLTAAQRRHVQPDLVRQALDAVDRFQQLIDAEAGDRSGFDAILSGWLPEARQKVELLAKQSVFRGVSQLLGKACEIEHCTSIVSPSPGNPDRADQVWLVGTIGLRRVRPGLPIHYYTLNAAKPVCDLAGTPASDLHNVLLEQFCSKPLPQMQIIRSGEIVQYTLSGDNLGPRSAINLTHATLMPERLPARRQDGADDQPVHMAVGIGTPCRKLIFDVLVHRDLYQQQDPGLGVYQAVGRFNQGGQRYAAMDKLEVVETLTFLGAGLSTFRSSDTPAYQEMVEYVCARRGLDPADLRGYRCSIEYPMYGSETVMTFHLPRDSEPWR